LAFCDKVVVSAYQTEEVSTHKKGALALSQIFSPDDEDTW
jgi:hypothetical protein